MNPADRHPLATSSGASRSRALTVSALLLLAGILVVLVLHARAFLPFIADDALISLRYSERLLAGQGLTWTDGERVEGYSNLLWVLGVAGLAPFAGGDLILAARLLGTAAMAAVIAALFFAHWPRRARDLLAPAVGGLVVAASGPIAVWAIGGLEQALLAGLLAWALALALPLADPEVSPSRRRVLLAGLPLALLGITRPDGVLFAAALGLALLLVRPLGGKTVRLILTLALLPVLAVGAQLVFRVFYYGDWVPNTAHAKVGFSSVRLLGGLHYLEAGARALPVLPVGLALGVGMLAVRGRRRRAILLLCPTLLWTAYVAVIGGDIFPAYRHLVALVVLAAFLAAEATAWLAPVGRRLTPAFALALLVPATVWAGHGEREIDRGRTERWEWEGEVVGTFLRRGLGPQRPLLAADPAGCLPFFSKLPSLDLLGLNDRYLATHPPPDFGRGWIGHELGDGAYVLRRAPDLLFFCGPLGDEKGCFRSGVEVVAAPEFRVDYTLVRFETPPPRVLRGVMWVRRQGRVGLREQPGRIEIPGLLLAGNPRTTVRARADGSLVASVSPTEPARIEAVRVPAGRWRLEARADGPASVRVRRADGQPAGEGKLPLPLDQPSATDLAFEVWATEGEIGLAALILQKE